MPLRTWLVRIMLGFLALAALGGVAGILVPGTDVVWRLVWTAVTTSVCCALLLAATRFVDRPGNRGASLYSMAVIVVEFLLALALIWEVADVILPGRDAWWRLLAAMGFIAMTQFPAVPFVRMLPRPTTRIAGVVGVAGLAVALVMLLASVVIPHGAWNKSDELMAAGITLVAATVIIGLTLIGAGRDDRRYWRWVGVTAAVIGYALLAHGIWTDTYYGDLPPRSIVILASLAIVVAHANLALYATLTPGQVWLRWATIAAIVATAVMVDLTVLTHDPPDLVMRLAAAAGICAACGSTALAVLARVNRRGAAPRVTPREITSIDLVCPHCDKRQRLPVGETSCSNCGLWITVRVNEPRCEQCGYLLYMLRGDRCPECGTPVPPRRQIADLPLPIAD
jgi:hypothetical protein